MIALALTLALTWDCTCFFMDRNGEGEGGREFFLFPNIY